MRLYIDDIRTPKGVFDKITRSSVESIQYMETYGCPEYISFDHDLGGDDTAMIIVKYMVEKDLDTLGEFIPKNFTWNVHSANTIGSANINGYLKSYINNKTKFN